MQRILVIVLAAVLVLTGTAWASDLHVDAPDGEPVSLEKCNGDEHWPDHPDHCGHCCHGAAHYVALPLSVAGLLSLPHTRISLQNYPNLIGLQPAPPTPPPNR